MSEIVAQANLIFVGIIGVLLVVAGFLGATATLTLVLPSVLMSRAYYWSEGKFIWFSSLGGVAALVVACLWVMALGMVLSVPVLPPKGAHP